jgi:iron complex outermembrane receptor protein
VAVTAFSGAKLQISGVKDMFDLNTIAPGLDVRQSGRTARGVVFRIRSIGTGSGNFGLESSVGLYVDGVYRARQGSLINNMLDVESIEVLRGPQGTLFGRNTLAGAVLMNTVPPSQDGRKGFAEVTLGNYDLLNVSGATSISAIDQVLAFRAAAFSSKRDGYVDDINLGDNTIVDRNRWGIRLQGLYTPSDSLSVRVIADYSEIDEICCTALVVQDNLRPVGLPPGATLYAGSDEVVRSLGGKVLTGDQFSDFVTAQNLLPASATDDSGVSVTVDWDLEAFSLISITGYRTFDAHDSYDADSGDLNSITSETTAEQSAWTQELRIHGDGVKFSYVAGLYYFSQELDNVSLLRFGEDINGLFSHTFAYYPGTNGQFPLEDISSFPLPSLPLFQPGSGARNSMEQDHEAYAVFGQLDYDLSEKLRVTAGLRYTREEKQLDGVFTQGRGPDYTDNVIALPIVLEQFYAIAPQDPVDESLRDDRVTGTLKMTWLVDYDTMLYASFSTGYKAGGTNTERINPQLDYVFDPETSEALEIGVKADFPEQALRLNAALHRTGIENQQYNSLSEFGPVLQNVGRLDTWGGEVELTWSPTDSLTLTAAYAATLGEVEAWKNDICWVAARFHTGRPDPGDPTQGENTVGCDRSGDDLAFNPDQLVITANQQFGVSDGVDGFLLVEYSYLGETDLQSGDPFRRIPPSTLVHARLGFRFENYGTDVTLWGRNILDEEHRMAGFDPIGEDGRVVATPLEPATWGITLRKSF